MSAHQALAAKREDLSRVKCHRRGDEREIAWIAQKGTFRGLNVVGGFEEVKVDVKVAGIKAHEDRARPPKKPNSTRELKIEIRIPADMISLWRGEPVLAGARRLVLHVLVPAMSARA